MPAAKAFFTRWLITALAVLVAAHIVPGIRYESAGSLIVASLLLGILNALVRPFLILVSLPLLVVTLGFFLLIINAFLLYFAAKLVAGFTVATFPSAILGALVVSIISILLNAAFGVSRPNLKVRANFRRTRPPPRGPGPGPGGPVIDV